MSTTKVDSHRRQMMQFLQEGRGYEFLNMASPFLDVNPEDQYTRLMAIREYLRLGLIQPAKELVEGVASADDISAEFDAIRTSVKVLRGDPIPWLDYAPTFDNNLVVLKDRGVDIVAIRRQWEEKKADYQLFRDSNQLHQIRKRDRLGNWRWFPCLGNHRALDDAREMPAGVGTNFPGPYLFEGLDLGGYFERVYHATLDSFLGYSCALYVVEPDPAALALVLHLHDWSGIIRDLRVFWIVGESYTQQLEALWKHDPDLPLPRQGFCSRSIFCRDVDDPAPSAMDFVQATVDKRETTLLRLKGESEDRYASRDLTYWAKRFNEAINGEGPPLRILAAVSTHTTFLQYSMRDAKRAFEALGHQCIILTETTSHHIISGSTYHKTIREFDPDLFFNIDHLRPELSSVIPDDLPLLTWDQDQLPTAFSDANIRLIGPLDFVTGWSKPKCVAAGCNPRQFLYARVPTCPEQFNDEPLTDEEEIRYACDVSYVSHASQTAKQFHDKELASYTDPTARRLLDTLMEMAPAAVQRYRIMGGVLANATLDDAMRHCGIPAVPDELRAHLTGWYLWRLGDRLFRHQALEWVADWARRTGRSFRIYGNGWDKHPSLSAFAAGPAQNGRELLCVYRASKINLQLMPAGFVHQRALDGLAGGGFFLSRATPYDLSGKILRQLDQRIEHLGITSSDELLSSPDQTMQDLLGEYHGDLFSRLGPHRRTLLNHIRTAAELPHPEDVFPRFREILFDSSGEFAQKAEHFLGDASDRRTIGAQMREVVIDRFSYQPAMDQFLRAMAVYLREAVEL